MVVDHDTLPSNRFPTAVLSHRRATVSRLCLAASRASETFFNNSSLWTFSPCCSITFLPNVVTESLNTSVRVCFAQPSHSGAECDPRHRGAVLHRKATTPKHHHSLDPHRQSPTPSPNQPIQWPPGPKTVPFEYIRFRISHACFFHMLPSCITAVTFLSAELKLVHWSSPI